MVSANENYRFGVFRKVEGALEVIAQSGAIAPKDGPALKALAQKLGLDLSVGEEAMVLDALNGTRTSPYAKPPKGVKDRYDHIAARWRLYKLGASELRS
jgi:hypothetical protein